MSSDSRTITINPETTTTPGEVICALLPDGPNTLPTRTTPCCFTVAAAAPAAYVAPAGNPFPWWIIPVGLGLGVGICAIAGCFNSSGGGGGSGSSSQ